MCVQVIVFSFSKKECEALALQMAPLDLNDEAEQKLVEGIFWNAVDCLSDDDRRLPQACMQPTTLDKYKNKMRHLNPDCRQNTMLNLKKELA